MATLAAASNHNFTAASWGVVDTTSLQLSSASNTNLSTSYVSSSTFTPGAITIDGMAVWVNTRLGATGTISIALDQATVTVAGTEVTINVTDIPSDGNCFVFFKFAAPVTLLAATAYSLKAKTSNATQVNLFRNATANNWSRYLRTTTTAAPAAADFLFIVGEKTGAGAGNTITVTMNNTAATNFGQVEINAGGVLSYGTAASTNYLLTLAADMFVRSGGELDIGTSGARIPSTSTAELAIVNVTNVDRGVFALGSGIIRAWGNHNANPWALLAADAAAAATLLTTNVSTGWKNGDVIGIASTTRTASECETKTLGADASGTSLPTIGALTNAHAGGGVTNGSDVVAELINLTRNVKIHGTSASLGSYINVSTTSIVDLNDAEIYFMGSNTTGKRGIDGGTTTGTFTASYVAIHDFAVAGSRMLNFLGAASVGAINITHCVFFNVNVASGIGGFIESASPTTIGAVTVDDCVGIKASGAYGFRFAYSNDVSNVRVAGAADSGIHFIGGGQGTITNLVSHSNTGPALETRPPTTFFTTISNLLLYRSAGGLFFDSAFVTSGIIFDTFTIFGCTSGNMLLSGEQHNLEFLNFVVRAGLVLTATQGIEFDGRFQLNLRFANGTVGGSGQTHSGGDVVIPNSPGYLVNVVFDHVSLSSATQVSGATNLGYQEPVLSALRFNFLGQTQNHKTWSSAGTWSYDTVVADASPSLRMTPTSATLKLISPSYKKGVLSGQAVTVSVKVRKSVIGDGAAYNGAQVRLFVRRNYGAGVTADALLDTSTVAADGAFETLSGVTGTVTDNCVLEFYLDCDGTAGWVNTDTLLMVAA